MNLLLLDQWILRDTKGRLHEGLSLQILMRYCSNGCGLALKLVGAHYTCTSWWYGGMFPGLSPYLPYSDRSRRWFVVRTLLLIHAGLHHHQSSSATTSTPCRASTSPPPSRSAASSLSRRANPKPSSSPKPPPNSIPA